MVASVTAVAKSATVFLVTGSSRGLGLELTRQLLARGESVIATCRDPAAESATTLKALLAARETKSAFAYCMQLDVADDASVASLPARLDALDVLGIDVLVHNAGVTAPEHPDEKFETASAAALRACFNVNSVAPLLLTQALLPKLRLSAVKKVFFVSTAMASLKTTTSGGSVSYRASKSALNMVARCLAGEHGLATKDGLKVTLCHPGWCDTDMGSSGGRKPPVTPEASVTGMLAVIDAMAAPHSAANFVDYTGAPKEW